jgi:alpha-glucoside transport system substrate-binding protein
MEFMKKISSLLVVMILLTVSVLSGCAGDKTSEVAQSVDGQIVEENEEVTSEGTYLERAYAGEFSGQTVTIMGAFADNLQLLFEDSLRDFNEKTQMNVVYEQSEDVTTTFGIRFDGGNAPDIISFPQPGALREQVSRGRIANIEEVFSRDYLEKQYGSSWLDMTMMEGPNGVINAGLWQNVNAKSFVWYPVAEFEENGYEIPTTWDELIALSDQMVEDGYYPWTLGLESGAATGWPATDWIEDFMLRVVSLEDYDRWVSGELEFTSPEVKKAFDYMEKIWFNEDYVYGGRVGIVNTNFGDAPKLMFTEPARALMIKQGSFIQDFFPDEVQPGDYDFFITPSIDEAYGQPLLVGGDTMSLVEGQDRPEVRAVLEFLTTGESLRILIENGAAISPHQDSDLTWYNSDMNRKIAEAILTADAVRFDGSDLMPAEVGTGSFWTGMVDWVSGATNTDEALKEIQSGFNK